MRLFVGIEVGPAIAAAAEALIVDLKRRAVRLAAQSKITWIPPERMHLTVRFIGNADAAQTEAIVKVLEQGLAVPPFVLEIAGAGSFPKSGAPRVIWAGVSKGRDRLDAIEREVTERLAGVGIDPEDRPYNPHLTLARVRDAAGLRADPLLERHRGLELGAAHVEAITLFESRLSPKGPTYVPVLHTPLGKSGRS